MVPSDDTVVAVIGLGYVGLPLAVEFGKKFRVIGFDLSREKVAAYAAGYDPTGEVSREDIAVAKGLEVTVDSSRIADADAIIVAVPTPVDAAHQPDFSPLISASISVGKHMARDAVVVFESTVYPGATEEVCIPLLERYSGMKWKQDFFVGYSPERINPGDKEHTLTNIVKIVSGDTPETVERVAALYAAVVSAGVFRAPSIKVAEAAKVIENTQRDLNIALVNELALIFDRLGIDTVDVLAAASTKWNFLNFKPGLVGGHCIGVDPYYLTYKAEMAGYHPEVILAGRRINDGMGCFVAEKTIKLLATSLGLSTGARIAIFGLTFKEDCPDIRNSRVPDIIAELTRYGIQVLIFDPLVPVTEAEREYGIHLSSWNEIPRCEAVIVAVAHREFLSMTSHQLASKITPGGVLMDVKGALGEKLVELRELGFVTWRI